MLGIEKKGSDEVVIETIEGSNKAAIPLYDNDITASEMI